MIETKQTETLTLSMKDFSFFGKDIEAICQELKTILEAGHYLILNMNQSTTLSDDLFTLDAMLAPEYEMHMRYKKDNGKAQVIVILQKKVIA